MPERISPPGIPPPRGPYSPAVRAGDFVFVFGPDPPGGRRYPATRSARYLTNIGRILEAASSSFKDVVKVNVYLAGRRRLRGHE